jgi:hypothetical protein
MNQKPVFRLTRDFAVSQTARAFALTVALLLLCNAALRAADDVKPTADVKLEPLFNGKDLTGFKVPQPNPWWKVVDGVLVGESDGVSPDQKKGNVMYTEKAYQDFVLESDVRFGDNIDSGFMYAGKPGPDIQVQIGVSRSLKVDMTGSVYYKGKYPENGRAKGVKEALKPGDWNAIRVEVKGKVTNVWLNGQHVLTFDCPEETTRPAPIGLQIHPGVKMKVEFKNMKIAELK